jgi:hypothetical protein
MANGLSIAQIPVLAVAALLLSAGTARAQNDIWMSHRGAPFAVRPVPFGPGENMTFKAKWGIFGSVGQGSIIVEAVDTVHGHPTYRLAFRIKGGVIAWKMDDVQRSWLDVGSLFARRFDQKLNQTTYKRDRVLEFFPEEMMWRRTNGNEEGVLASAEPLDDVSFLYFARTLPLEPGATYTLQRYFRESGNPVVAQVLRRERIKLGDREYDTVVVRPIIRTRGIFSEGGEAEVWITDDDERIIVKLRAKASIGTLTMELESYTPGTRLVGPSGMAAWR